MVNAQRTQVIRDETVPGRDLHMDKVVCRRKEDWEKARAQQGPHSKWPPEARDGEQSQLFPPLLTAYEDARARATT